MTMTIDLDAKLVAELIATGHAVTEREAIAEALDEVLALRKQSGILSLQGIGWDLSFDYKAARTDSPQDWDCS